MNVKHGNTVRSTFMSMRSMKYVISLFRLIILIMKFVGMEVTELRDTNVYVYYVINMA